MSLMNNAGNNMAQSSSDDIQELEKMVMAFRMQELKSLLTSALQPCHGRKSDMLSRALTLVRTTKSEMVKRKVRQLYWHIYDKDRALLEANYTGPAGMSVGSGSSPYGIYATPAASVTVPPNSNMTTSRSVPSLLTQNAARQNIELHPNVKLTHLPFYDMLREVLKPTSLVPMATGKYQENHFTFTLTREQLNMISHNDKTPLPRTELQLRFCLLDTKKDQKDDFPSQCVLRMNDRVVPLPNVIPTNKVGVEAKRPSRPVDVTPQIIMRGNGDQRIHVSWQSDSVRVWTVSVYIVRHLNAAILYDRVRNKGERPEIESIRMIKEKLGNDDCDREIATTSLRVSLLCPLGKVRMRLPCRLRSCTHLQCFDLELFLHMNEKKPTWTCPVCDAPTVPFSDLQVDGYFMRLMAQTTNESEVELYEGGGFAPISDADSIDLDNDDRPKGGRDVPSVSAPVSTAPSSSATQPKPTPPASSQVNSDDDCVIIDLISDDEDDRNCGASKSRCISTTSSDNRVEVVDTVRSPSTSPSLIILDSPSPTAGKSTPEDPRMSGEESALSAAREQLKRSLMPESSAPTQSSPKRFRYVESGTSKMTATSVGNYTTTSTETPNFPDMVRQLMTAMPLSTPPFSTSAYMPVPLPPRMGDTVSAWAPSAPSNNGVSSTSSTGTGNILSSEWAPPHHLSQEFEAFLKSCFPPSSQ